MSTKTIPATSNYPRTVYLGRGKDDINHCFYCKEDDVASSGYVGDEIGTHHQRCGVCGTEYIHDDFVDELGYYSGSAK